MFNLKFVLGQRAFKSQRRLVNEVEHVSRVHFAAEFNVNEADITTGEDAILIASGNSKYSAPKDTIRDRHMRLMMIAQERGSMRYPLGKDLASRRASDKTFMNKTMDVGRDKLDFDSSFQFPESSSRPSVAQPTRTAAPSMRADAQPSVANSSGVNPAEPQGWLAQVEALARTYQTIDSMRPRILKLFLMIR